MTPRQLAILLRGINVGKHNKLPMSQLRELLGNLGYADVRTLLQSGNAVATTADSPTKVADAVTAAISDTLGLTVPCVVLDRKELAAAFDGCPLLDIAENHSRLALLLLSRRPTTAMLARWDPRSVDPENVAVGPRVIYQWCPDGIHLAPPLLPQVEKQWGLTGTGRNYNTTEKLLAMMG